MNAKDKWVAEVESSLNGLRPAEDPYLYSKIINRLNSGVSNYAPAKLVWATAASVALLIFLNVMIFKGSGQKAQTENTELVQLADQFQLNNNSLINYN